MAEPANGAVFVDAIAPGPAGGGSYARKASSSANGASKARRADESDNVSVGEQMRAYLRDYFLGFVPPHIRRKGLRMPPIQVRR